MTEITTSYRRYSSLEQSKGDSLRRQAENIAEFCARQVWTIEEDLTDEGRSAYHGANRNEGSALHGFEQRVMSGLYSNYLDTDGVTRVAGRILAVEHLDRISRQGWEEVYRFLSKMTQNGVTVATSMDGKIYRAFAPVRVEDIIPIIVLSEKAQKESQDKSKRNRQAWDKRLSSIREGSLRVVTSRCPMWLTVEKGEYRRNEARVAVVNSIFEMSANGMGAPAIARRLNEKGIATFGEGKCRAKGGWSQGVVSLLLGNRAVLGEYQRFQRIRNPFSMTPVGDPIPDLYPQVVTTDLFNRAQSAREARRGTGGKRGQTQANAFMGIARCRHCGGRMTYTSTRKAGDLIRGQNGSRKPITFVAKVGNSSLRCDTASRKVRDEAGNLKCSNAATIRYEYLEAAVLDRLLHIALDNVHFLVADKAAAIQGQIAELERSVANRGAELLSLAQALKHSFSSTVLSMVQAGEAEQSRDDAALATLRSDLTTARGEVSHEEHLARVREVRAAMSDPDPDTRLDARIRVHQALKAVITEMVCGDDKTTGLTVANGLAVVEIDGKGRVREGGLVVRRKEYQVEGLRAVEGNADRVDAVLRRVEKLTGKDRGGFISDAALKRPA